jgi:hypothetical protein
MGPLPQKHRDYSGKNGPIVEPRAYWMIQVFATTLEGP